MLITEVAVVVSPLVKLATLLEINCTMLNAEIMLKCVDLLATYIVSL